MPGVHRLPALCTQGHSLEQLGLQNYEVVHCDPLHDFKNVIQNLMEELPHQVQNLKLKSKVSEFCTTCIGERRNIRGTDVRQYLVNLALLLENIIYQQDR